MSFLKAKQIKLVNEGDMIVANSNGQGSVLPKGAANTVLQGGENSVSYKYLDSLRDVDTGFAVVRAVEDAVNAVNGEFLTITNASNEVQFLAKNAAETGDVHIRLIPQANGQVFIGASGSSIIQGDNGEDLFVYGGNGAAPNGDGGDVILGGGEGAGSGANGIVRAKDGYVIPSDAPAETFITKGYLTSEINDAVTAITRTEARDQTTVFVASANYVFNLSHTPVGAIDVMINGINLDSTEFTLSGAQVTLIDSAIGYSVEVGDMLQVRYEYNG